jgi:parallel beta-helix repeat protein
MTDDRSKALVAQDPTSLSPLSRLAERTLAERVEREERALVTSRTLVVGPGGYTTIAEAVDAARDGDTILVRPGRYQESVVVQKKSITITGDGERDAIVVGWDLGPAFRLIDTQSTLSGLTILGGDPHPPEPEIQAALLVTGGAPRLSWLRVTQGQGIVFGGSAAGAIEHSQIDRNDCGILVREGASPLIEANEIWGNADVGIQIEDESDPVVRANRIQGGGISVWSGASPRIEENEIWASALIGISISDAGSDPLIWANRVHDGHEGISAWDGASPRIEENEIWANEEDGISIGGPGTDAVVRANRVHDGLKSGISVGHGASPRIEKNEVWANAGRGIEVTGTGTSPLIIGNTVRDGLDDGISVWDSASPTIEGNAITGNAGVSIFVFKGAHPTIGQNVVLD